MGTTAVQEILNRIDQLPEEERLLLNELVVNRRDTEWQREAEKARHEAQARGIKQDDIDRAVEDMPDEGLL